MDGSEHLPHQDQEKTNGNYSSNDPKDNAHDVDDDGALLGLLHPHLQLTGVVPVPVHKGESAIIIIKECTADFFIHNLVLYLLHHDGGEGTLVTFVYAHLILDIMKLSRLELFALYTGLQLLAFTRTGWTVLTELTAVLTIIILVTLTLTTHTLAVTGAQFTNVFSVGGYTGFIAGSALAGCVTRYLPFRVTLTLSANTFAVVGSRAEQAVVAVTREVITLTILPSNLLLHILTFTALTLPADTISPVVTNCRGSIIRPATSLQVSSKL